jgi:carbonic anhydrase
VIAKMVDGIAAEAPVSANVRHVFDDVRPAIDQVLRSPLAQPGGDRTAPLAAATRANVRWSANQLRHGSELITDLVQRGKVLVVGAEYSLETGEVDFFDGMPA